jgi:hypothetical protein
LSSVLVGVGQLLEQSPVSNDRAFAFVSALSVDEAFV